VPGIGEPFLQFGLTIIGATSSAYSLSWGKTHVSKIRLLEKLARSFCVLSLLFLAAGCGQVTPRHQGMPAVLLSPNPVNFPATSLGATSSPIVVTVNNSGSAPLNISSVTPGGTNPGDFTNTNGCTASVPPLGTCTISVTFVPTASGLRSETLTLADHVPGNPQVINVSGTANPISITLTPQTSAIAVSQTLPFTASGDPAGVTWSLAASTNSGPGATAPAGTIDASGNYTPPPGSPSLIVAVTATSKTDPTKSASATVNVAAPGQFANTNNVQVAQYAVSTAASAKVSVQFGLDTSYGLTTWTQPTPQLGGPVSLFVAGMKASTPYHMRGVLQFADGTQFLDADQTFTTGALPANLVPTITTTTTPGMTPQSGVELLDMVVITPAGKLPESVVTDLSGNALWAYQPALPGGPGPNPVKLLPNGHFLINFSGNPDGANAAVQEVDLGGNVIWQMTTAELNTALAAATCAECNVTVIGTHHDFQVLSNGHLIVLASLTQTLPDSTTPTGDIVIDLGDMENVGGNNPNHVPQPVWAWNEFNHLDTNRRPYMYPDWTHSNAVIYSKDDGNLIISIRHQNWLVKIDYNNGVGAGDILWKLGAKLPTDTGQNIADFTLMNADGTADTNEEDWFFAQHGPAFASSNTTGKFSLVLFDNGDDRGVVDVAGGTCGVAGQPACFSTVPLFDIDETAKTATFVIHPTTPDYTFFGGNAEVLANGNVEYDECGATMPPTNSSFVYEVTNASTLQTVWKMQITGQYAYRGMRIGSLYPGVQW
jgi:arylsulfate sulfotransferase